MLGAVNMGRGIGFQRRTGARARQMPGRPLGVRGPSFGVVTMDVGAGVFGSPPTCWMDCLALPHAQSGCPAPTAAPSLHNWLSHCCPMQNVAEMAVFRRANDGVAQAARDVQEASTLMLLQAANRCRRHLVHN